MTRILKWGRRSLRERGAKRTLGVAVNYLDNWWFDVRHGTNTAPVIPLSDLDVSSENKELGYEYRASKGRPLQALLGSLDFPTGSTFVDFGCGKGKALMVAAAFDFRELVGVEFSRELCQTARANLAKFISSDGPSIRIVESDAVLYDYSGAENVLYFYNPFGEIVLRRVLESLERSLIANPRPIWILYFAPQHRVAFDAQPFLRLAAHRVLGGADHLIYENTLHRGPS